MILFTKFQNEDLMARTHFAEKGSEWKITLKWMIKSKLKNAH